MSNTLLSEPDPSRNSVNPVSFGIVAVVMFFVLSGCMSYWNTHILKDSATQVTHTHGVILGLSDIMSYMRDAETGQRGYVITGDNKYLEPYNAARSLIASKIERISQLTQDNEEQQAHLPAVRAHINAKFAELEETINLRRTQGFDAARSLVITDRGKGEMDALRNELKAMTEVEQALREQRMEEVNNAYGVAVICGIAAALLGVVLSVIISYMMQRTTQARQREQWLQTGQVGLANVMIGEQNIDQLAENILNYFTGYLNAHAGAFFAKRGSTYRRIKTYGVPEISDTPTEFGLHDGLLGQAVREKRSFRLDDVPEGYLTLGSGLGKGSPRYLIIFPTVSDEEVLGVVELGFVNAVNQSALELINTTSKAIGVAIRSTIYREELQNLLEETQRQAEELQSHSEELRVNNEELEEQSRALKESQARLEQQQVEMEQTNAQLEEQALQLEGQRDDLSRANEVVQLKARELEQASKYKSDFLANMSHELRTPLNSSLILAKLLADNPAGNLTQEQVQFAQTIQSSGNDLLSLINDILDLSKIEAGHMEIRPEHVPLDRLLKDITRTLEPVARQKGLSLRTDIAPNCPHAIETDRQRLEQVLKNLLSNAIKFTEKGEVALHITHKAPDFVSFTVSDTGIGIAPEQQQAIFEAFRQADGTISRKYGGTGLGLSISRELARLLGGAIDLESEQGHGSAFSITLPHSYHPANIAPRTKSAVAEAHDPFHYVSPSPAAHSSDPHSTPTPHHQMEDDRDRLTGDRRIILVVEDDKSFAQILYSLAHELDFQCLIANSAEEAIVIAKQYVPSAVVLDVGLPDNSGLSVLDRLKRDTRTRHIPVHVVSAGDHAQTALSLGAVGYMIKPVKREQLIDTLKGLETKFEQRMRRILIVEDDQVQRESMCKLLGSHDVQTIAVGTAAECLKLLKESTFDCMVLDLSLPDSSGYALLETLSREDNYSFPPVIVYTGRDLSADEEQKLRRYSKSIIIKGAKSPERLLDEVTLFLHQVVAELPAEQQRMLEKARNRDTVLEGKRILAVEDDVRNVYALTNILEPQGAIVEIARNGREALQLLDQCMKDPATMIDLVLMDVMMPEMDGLTATREIRKRSEWKKLPIIMLTAKAMRDDQERCLDAGANDYMAKPLDVEKLLSLVRVWMPR